MQFVIDTTVAHYIDGQEGAFGIIYNLFEDEGLVDDDDDGAHGEGVVARVEG